MKCTTRSLTCFLAALGILLLCSCVHNNAQTEAPAPTTADLVAKAAADPVLTAPAQLPVRYQNPGFVTAADDKIDADLSEDEQGYRIKVGADINSTKPQPLVTVLKGLARLKGMSVSWASDVNRFVPVDVNITANDYFSDAIDNMLRQVDYFHEINGSTIIVRFKETKRFHVAMPFTTQLFETKTGGNVLGSGDDNSSIEGTIRLESRENKFDFWSNIEENIKIILGVVEEGERAITSAALGVESQRAAGGTNANISDSGSTNLNINTNAPRNNANVTEQSGTNLASVDTSKIVQTVRQTSPDGEFFIIDDSLGIITVTAKPSVLKKIEEYLAEVKKQLYQQVTIEAKIIEVQLEDSSTLGIDWNLLLRSLSFGGSMALTKDYQNNIGPDGTSYTKTDTSDFNRTKENSRSNNNSRTNSVDNQLDSTFSNGSTTSGTDGTVTYDDGVLSHTGLANTDYLSESTSENSSSDSTTDSFSSLASTITTAATIMTGGASNTAAGLLTLSSFNFADFLHALSEQGKTSILANPKLSVMNGQPALITVGRNVTYIDSIESDVTAGTTVTTNYTVNTERILSGVGLSLTPVIRDGKEIIMTLVPVTSVLEEPIEYRQVGLGEVGLPIINVREMSSMVKVKDGEMLVIGGLISTVESTVGENLFPGLANVPILKYLTGYETKVLRKRELIILLRPRII